MIPISLNIKRIAQDLNEKDQYLKIIETLKNNTRKYVVNRDGDLFRIKCPSCKTKDINHMEGPYFVCKQGHFFCLYTEDGVMEETEDIQKKILGDDLQKGKDSHGHAPYETLKPDEFETIYLSKWFENLNITPTTAANELQVLWDLLESKKFYGHPLNDSMMEIALAGGKFKPNFDNRIRTWPKRMKNMRWVILLNIIKDTGWTVLLNRFERV